MFAQVASDRTPSLTNSGSSSSDSLVTPPSPHRPVPIPRKIHTPSFRQKPKGGRLTKTNSIAEQRPLSTYSPRRSLQTILQKSGVFVNLLHYLSPDEFRAITSTCQEFRQLFRYPVLKDAALSRFVPGYRACLHHRDPQQFVDVAVTARDLHLFLISEKIGLHAYPMHSLALTSALLPSVMEERTSAKLRALGQAHSRFVLLLQSLAHSSSSPANGIEDIGWRFSAPPGVKELQFPAPLSYHEFGLDTTAIPVHLSERRHAKLKPTPSAADCYIAPTTRLKRRTTFFGGRKSLPPPPSPNSTALRQHSEGWRRIMRAASSVVDDFGSLKAPRHRFGGSISHSSDSSLSGGQISPRSSSVDPERSPTLPPRGTSPHDFSLASSRNHAPILRVFVPCSELDEPAIIACEEQLMESGLWDHLSTGDIVCNLGYMPHTDNLNGRKEWLIHNGFSLVAYSPPDPPPVDNALLFPSPFYYSHILPAFSNPIYALNMAPHLPSNAEKPRFALTYVLTKVNSPHSPCGFALVKKYKWLATIRGPTSGVGNVWQTEWVLEGEGTTEGRELLENLISGRENCKSWLWEVEREKSSQSRLWLRLLGNSSTFVTAARPRTTSFLLR